MTPITVNDSKIADPQRPPRIRYFNRDLGGHTFFDRDLRGGGHT